MLPPKIGDGVVGSSVGSDQGSFSFLAGFFFAGTALSVSAKTLTTR